MYILCVKNNFVLKVRIVEVCLVLWQKAGDPATVFRAGPQISLDAVTRIGGGRERRIGGGTIKLNRDRIHVKASIGIG